MVTFIEEIFNRKLHFLCSGAHAKFSEKKIFLTVSGRFCLRTKWMVQNKTQDLNEENPKQRGTFGT